MYSDRYRIRLPAEVLADLEEPGDEDIIRKVMNDIENRGAKVTETDVRLKLDEFLGIASKQIISE